MEENQEQEKIFYTDYDVTVTQSRYLAHNKTYAMRNISSVSLYIIGASYVVQILLLFVGLAMLIAENTRIIGIIILAISVFWIVMTKDKYAVRISTNAGETNSLVSKNKNYIQKVVTALSDAIIYRG